jgi:hypothetical protein
MVLNNPFALTTSLLTKYNTILEAVQYFNSMYLSATDSKSKAIWKTDLDNTINEQIAFELEYCNTNKD